VFTLCRLAVVAAGSHYCACWPLNSCACNAHHSIGAVISATKATSAAARSVSDSMLLLLLLLLLLPAAAAGTAAQAE
jgi:hypothetical protein